MKRKLDVSASSLCANFKLKLQASRYETDWQQTFWGDNYARLLQIKRRVDPEDVFWCTPCVGSERWREVDDLLCRI